jgi:prolyl oligopeptidase PreP (S9A serine peptidase family)
LTISFQLLNTSILEQYTRKEKLAIAGGSNGGLLVGACMTQRPDLFQVALPAVGVSLNNKTLDHECD